MNQHCAYCKFPRNQWAPAVCPNHPFLRQNGEHLWIRGTSPKLRQVVKAFNKHAKGK